MMSVVFPIFFTKVCIICIANIYFQSMFCDVRQFIAYVKEIHGGTFRRVELSGLLDSVEKLKKKEKEKTEKVKKNIPIR